MLFSNAQSRNGTVQGRDVGFSATKPLLGGKTFGATGRARAQPGRIPFHAPRTKLAAVGELGVKRYASPIADIRSRQREPLGRCRISVMMHRYGASHVARMRHRFAEPSTIAKARIASSIGVSPVIVGGGNDPGVQRADSECRASSQHGVK